MSSNLTASVRTYGLALGVFILISGASSSALAAAVEEVIVTDTIPIKPGHDKITVLTTANLFSEVISRALKTKSISSLYQIKGI